jgi:hypothetical protein
MSSATSWGRSRSDPTAHTGNPRADPLINVTASESDRGSSLAVMVMAQTRALGEASRIAPRASLARAGGPQYLESASVASGRVVGHHFSGSDLPGHDPAAAAPLTRP